MPAKKKTETVKAEAEKVEKKVTVKKTAKKPAAEKAAAPAEKAPAAKKPVAKKAAAKPETKTEEKKETVKKPAVKKAAEKKAPAKKTAGKKTTAKKAAVAKKSAQDYKDVINWKKWEAHNMNWLYIEINAGDLLTELEAGVDNMDTCCAAIRDCMLEGDGFIVEAKGADGTLTVRYYCDNLSEERRKYSEVNA